MINRMLLRIKIIQLLYAYQKNPSKSVPVAEKELFHSLQQTYHLYHYLLQLILDVTFYAQKRLDSARNKLIPTAAELNPNLRFVENTFVQQLANNEMLQEYLKEHKLSWINHPSTIKNIYGSILESDFYAVYMNAEEVSYEEDKELWRKIFKRIILGNEDIEAVLEEQSIYWNDDLDIVLSFVLKTIKKFEQNKGAEQPLMPMFKDEVDKEFASKLFTSAIIHEEEYKALIEEHTQNWEMDRIAFMDTIIMQAALSELLNFPTIPVNVTLNEYIEIAKTYSSEKSNTFINGVLDNLVNKLKRENKLIKAKVLPKQ